MAGKRPGTDDDHGVAETQRGPQYDLALLPRLLNAHDIEEAATRKLSKRAWAYYYSAGDDLISKRLNSTAWQSILLRPRVFVDCTSCDLSTTLLGHKVGTPLFVCPAAQARLGHPSGENGIARGISSFDAIQIVSNSASMTPEQVVEGAEPSQVFGWQLYVQNDREKSEKMLQRVNALSKWYKFIALTVDTAVSGKREDDERQAFSRVPSVATPSSRGGGAKLSVIQSLGGGLAADITWETTLPWLAEHTKLPIVVKGIQTHEDAELALHYARRYPGQIKGIVLSNHGGRSLDTAPPAVHTLLEIRLACPEVFSELEVWIDGGIKRGTDIVKALCLGAKAVGIGRLPLYGLAVGGAKGVERVFEILQQEMLTCMRLLGASSIADLNPAMVNTRAAERDIYIPYSNLHSSAKGKL